MEDVGEREKSGFSREDAADVLHCGAVVLDAVEFFDAFIVILGNVSCSVRAGSVRSLLFFGRKVEYRGVCSIFYVIIIIAAIAETQKAILNIL